jgi:hypothetical protein
MARAVGQRPYEPPRDAVRVGSRAAERVEPVSWDAAIGSGFGVLGRWLDIWVSRIGSTPVRHI